MTYTRKFGPSAKRAMAAASSESTRRLRILMRVSGELDEEQRAQLAALCEIRTIAGSVISAEVPDGALVQLVQLDFVSYVEVAQTLYPESK